MKIKITTKFLQRHGMCDDEIAWYMDRYADNTVKLVDILADLICDGKWLWANWLITKLLNEHNNVNYALFSAELALPIFEKYLPKDARPRDMLVIAKKYAHRATMSGFRENEDIVDPVVDYAAYIAGSAAYKAVDAIYAAYSAAKAKDFIFRHVFADRYTVASATSCIAYNAYSAASNAAAVGDAETHKKIIGYGTVLLVRNP